jgi:DNA-binding HxlR family transcriptional regulator
MQRQLTSLAGVLGRKWNLVIINRLLRDGPQGFSDLLTEIDDISSKVLSESLDDLEESGLVDRSIVSERPFRVEYALTERATALETVIDAVQEGSLTVA